MRNQFKPASYLIAITIGGAPVVASAQGLEKELGDEVIVVTASRLSEQERESASEVTILEAEEREKRQQYRLQEAINLAPGVISTSTAGQDGQTGTLIIRGLNTSYNQVMVDGGTYGNMFGNVLLGVGENVEIVKGGQAVHGNGAFGGVLGVNTPFSEKAPESAVTVEVGSFEYLRSSFSSAGKVQDFQYYLSSSSVYHDQDLPVSEAYQVTHGQLNLGLAYALNGETTVRVTGRRGESELERAGLNISNEHDLWSLQFLTEHDDRYQSALILGYFTEDYSNGEYFYETELEKLSLTFDHKYQMSDVVTLRGGLDFSWNEFYTSFHQAPIHWDTYGLYVGGQYEVGNVVLGVDARAEKNTQYDFLPAVSASARYLRENAEIFFKVSQAERAPSLLESEAFPAAFQTSNPSLEEEEITSVELGGETEWMGQRVSLTGYAHFLRNAITPQYGALTQFVNTGGSSEIYGLEASATGQVWDSLFYRLAWNYSLKNEVIEVPRNTVNADVYYDDGGEWLVGAGVGHRTAAGYGGRVLDAHVVTRIYGHYSLTESLKLSGRVENLFNEEYEVNPFGKTEGKGASAYFGVTYQW